MDIKIGVYICHCGTNIAATVDVVEVAQFASTLPNVTIAREYQYVCSDPGQDLIINDIKELGLTRVVVASCSPRMHEMTFRKVLERTGLNPYLFQMANIREHCSWVHENKFLATKKAKALINAAVRRVALHDPLEKREVDVNPDTLIVGAGIAGIQAALEIANSGNKVYLVEKEPSIGGHMAMFDKTFPTLDCAACILTPKMTQVGQHENIELLTYSEAEEISGYVGNFEVKIRKKARSVDLDKCTGCGLCWENCLVRNKIYIPEIPEIEIEDPIREKVDQIIEEYKDEKGALISILQDINLEYQYLPEPALKYVAQKLNIPLSEVFHVATFYTAFSLTPRGEHLIKVCLGTACHVRGARKVLEEIERRLNITAGQTTEDLKFTLETVNCLGACALGPIVVIDGEYFGQMTTAKVGKLLKKYAKPEEVKV